MSKEELKELIKQLVQEYTGTGASGGNATDGNDIPSPRPFADDEEELENYLFKNIYGGEGGHYRKDSDPFNYNRTKMGMFELKNYIKKYLKEQLDPAKMQDFQDEKIELQKDLLGVDLKITRETAKATIDNLNKQLAATVEPMSNADKQVSAADKEKESLRSQENQTNNELSDLNKLEVGVEISPKEKEERKKEIEERLAQIKQQQEAVEQKIEAGKQAKQQVLDQKNQIMKSIGQTRAQFSQQRAQQKKAIAQVGKVQEIKADDYGSATLTTQGQYKSRFTKTGKPPGIMDEMNTCPKCGKMGHDASHHKHDHEGKMAKSQLYKIHQYAERLLHMLPDDAQLPAWVQSKFTNAAHSIGAAFHYLDYEVMSHHDNLMENMDSYKREALMEGTMKKFFKMFDEGKTNEEVLRHYAGKGVTIPETFLSKARKQYENLKKQKLEIEFSEQEAKDFKPAPRLQGPAEESKKLSSRLYKEKLDPVGQEDGDIDNDGDEDKTDQYLLKRRKAVSKAIEKQKKKK